MFKFSQQKTIYRFALVFLLVLVIFNLLPLLVSAQIVPLGEGGGDGPGDYKWPQLVQLFQNIVDFIFVDLMIPLAVVALVYAGIKILIGRSKPEDLIKAKGALRNVALGIFLALGAYAIVKTILTLLPGGDSGFLQDVIDQVFG